MKIRSPRTLIVLAVAALISPVASATWYAHGSHEPDNAFDKEAFMFFDPAPIGVHQIYLNVVEGIGPGIRGMHISPNVALLETTHTTPVLETWTALFGVWVDCNGDGYVGLGDTGAREYPATLLLDDTACPSVNGDADVWVEGAHNYNGWVSELVPIGGATAAFVDDEYDARVYRDPDAMVWGDPGLPDDPASVGGTCPLAPQPRGTYQSTGGFLNYVGCFTGLLNHWNNAFQGRQLAGQNVPGIESVTGPTGLTFPNGDARGSWADVPTFGSEDTQYSPAHVWDCNADPALHTGDFINETAGDQAPGIHEAADAVGINSDNFSVYQADPRPGNVGPSATIPAFVNDTQEGLEDCDTSNDNGHDFYGNNYVFYVGETDFAPVSGANKTSAQFNFQFQDWGRGLNALGFENATEELGPVPATPWPDSPIFGGAAGMAAPYGEFSNWNPGVVSTTAGVPNRYAFADANTGDAGIAAGTYFSFYAHVGKAMTDRNFGLPGGSGTYGSGQCGDEESGIHNGWNCDPSLWYHNPDGSPQPEPTPLARVGQTYQFRDIDCFDGRTGTGIAIGTAAYGPSPCPPS